MIQTLFPRWRTTNKRFDLLLWIIAFAIAIMLALAIQSLGTEQKGPFSVIICFASRLILSFAFNRFLPDSLIGAVRLDYNEIDWEFRKLFKENAISFHRQAKNKTYDYDFPAYNLSVTLQSSNITRNAKPRLITKVTFNHVSAKNRSLADKLTDLIDEMVEQPTREPRIS